MNERPLIAGKVASIITDQQIVINRGRAHGVFPKMLFGIYLVLEDIIDPEDASNILRGIRYEKGRAVAARVYETMTFCNLESRGTSFPAGANLPAFLTGVPQYPMVERPLLQGADWRIVIGDAVEELAKPPAEGKKKSGLIQGEKGRDE